jgi:putative hemolysin
MRDIPNPALVLQAGLADIGLKLKNLFPLPKPLVRKPAAIAMTPASGAAERTAHDTAGVSDSTTHEYSVSWAKTAGELRAAQALRWQVFAGELGAQLKSPVHGLDVDSFDPFCDHLLVKNAQDEIVGTYRALIPAKAEACGMWYSSTEFHLKPLFAYANRAMEVGRSCVDADHRNGSVMMMLWQELARHMQRHHLDVLFGCASVPLTDGGHMAASLWRHFLDEQLIDEELFCSARNPLPLEGLDHALKPVMPPLLKGYLRLGARIASAPALDKDFNCADFLIVLRKENITPRYARHFFGVPLAAHA